MVVAGGPPSADATVGGCGRATIRVTNIPPTAIARELFDHFESAVGSVFACEIFSSHKNWKSRGSGRVQFDSLGEAKRALALAAAGKLAVFQGAHLNVLDSLEDIFVRAADAENRAEDVALYFGNLVGERVMEVDGKWEEVRVEVMKERGKMEVFLEEGGESYKLEVSFGDIVRSFGCRLGGGDGDLNAVLFQLKYAPRIYHRIHTTALNTKFRGERYHFCKQDVQFFWVRAPDFSSSNIIGRSCYLCLEFLGESPSYGILKNLPFFGELGGLILRSGEFLCHCSTLVPIVNCPSDCTVPYEVLFHLNSLVHLQKISPGQVDCDLFEILSGLSLDVAINILTKMQKLNSTCYMPLQFIQNQLAYMKNQKSSFSNKRNQEQYLMSCHRILVTPSKVYFLGPELETSNYVVKHFSTYASDFVRVSFVDEDWSKLSPQAISATIEQGIFSKPFRTGIYSRILSILRDGISIGSKKFEFLAFSASQLRANSVWMFASNDRVTAEDIRKWMGYFNKIHSVSKCAARMGQLFSSSSQTLNVQTHEVRIIPDVEVVTDGIKYCFSDGIGKISLSFARQVAQKCGLNHTPSAFQIRYGGYKGVVAVDRTSFVKLSLRPSMSKFDSKNTMLNITSWSKYLPCFLNREIVCLLSTLGIEDEIFESLQQDHMHLLDHILTSREVALTVLGRMTGSETKTALKMLMNGYEPNSEPYLLMMLTAFREHQLSDIRSRCRVFVPNGRVLIGCLDETGILDYGQVYLRVSLTKEELQKGNQTFFDKIDCSTAVVVGKVVVTKNPCLHPGDIRVLQAVYEPQLDNKGLVDCLIFPKKGERHHPNECSGGDLDGDLYFVCWDERLIPLKTDAPMDYIERRPRLMDHEVTLEEIQKFFAGYMINDSLGVISTAHLVHCDREPSKARSPKCLQLAQLHSMAVDYAKTGVPAEMPNMLRPREYPDFMERWDKPTYKSTGVLGKLYRKATGYSESNKSCNSIAIPYDYDLEVDGFEAFLQAASDHYSQYAEKLSSLMKYYEAEHEDEILTGNLRSRSVYLRKDKNRYEEMKDRMLIGVQNLHKEVEGWFRCSCSESESWRMASAWYHVTYHPSYRRSEARFLSFPWIVNGVLLRIKASKTVTMEE